MKVNSKDVLLSSAMKPDTSDVIFEAWFYIATSFPILLTVV